MLEPNARVIMISGANRGIGKSIATELANRGYRLSLGVRDPSTLANTDNAQTLVHQWDATSTTDSQAWVQATLDRFKQIDGVVLNAGVLLQVSLDNGSEDDLDTMWEVNFKGPFRLVRAALPALIASGHGRVINVVSLSGKRVLSADTLGYAASKCAALSLTHAIRQHGWEHGVRATAICPGLVETDMTAGTDPPAGQFKMSPDTIAATAAYALSLPNEATVAEILVNGRLESTL